MNLRIPGGPVAVSVGSFPGIDPAEPVRIMSGENPALPSVPELPGRGPGGEMIGRTLGLLSQVAPEFAGETTPTGWRLAGRVRDAGNRAMRRAASWLAQDLDVAEQGYAGAPAVKVQVAGPWTLAGSVDLPSGHRVLADPGALRDLLAAYPDAVSRLAGEVRRRWPAAVVQLDEPLLPQVLAAAIPTPSGMDRYRAPAPDAVRDGLRRASAAVRAQGASILIHCCALPAPVPLLRSVGADGLSLDLTGQRVDGAGGQDEEALGELLEAGEYLVAGVVRTTLDGPAEPAADTVRRVMALLNRLGIGLDTVSDQLAVSTACGLAGSSPDGARRSTIRVHGVASLLAGEVA